MEDRVFSDKNFQAWGKQDVVLFASVMTRIEGRDDDALLSDYGFSGFPSLGLLDSEGEMVTKAIGRDLYSMQAVSAAAPAYYRIKPKVDAGEGYDKAAWFMARLGMGELKLADVKKEVPGLKLNDKQQKAADTQIFMLELDDLMQKLRSRALEMDAAGDVVYGYYTKGRRLPAGAALASFFDQMLVKGASKAKDADAFMFAYPRVKGGMSKQLTSFEKGKIQYKGNERAQEYFDRNIESTKKQIDELEAQAKGLKK
jgi:hypothetical protein